MSDAQEVALKAAQDRADETNKERKGVGTRVRVGQTRGKNPQVISWEAFDESQEDTLPKSIAQFMEVTGVKQESDLVSALISGYNDAQYTAASDPIAEHIDASWSKETQTAFRLVVRNYSKMMGVSIDDAAAEIKPKMAKLNA